MRSEDYIADLNYLSCYCIGVIVNSSIERLSFRGAVFGKAQVTRKVLCTDA